MEKEVNKNPKVSVVTVTYNLINANRKETFLQCVESVKNQTYDNIEHIIIDGASTDGTLDLIKSTGITYYSKPDKGIYDAMNKGIKKSSGKYIIFLNSDDYWSDANGIKDSVIALEEEKADFSYAPFKVIDINGKLIQKTKATLKRLPTRMPICHQTMLAKKEMLNNLNCFDDSYKICADFDLLNKALLAGYKPVKINNCFVVFREGGISSVHLKTHEQEVIKVIQNTCLLSKTEAITTYKTRHIPHKVLENILSNVSDKLKKEILKNNRNNYLKHLKRNVFSIRFNKKIKIVKLFGITFYKKIKQKTN